MTWKKITLTDAIVDDIALYLGREYLIPGRPEVTTYPPRADTMDAWRIITAVLSHPDARGLFTDEDDRPWEPLSKGDPLNVGDEVRCEMYGITTTAVVGRVDGGGNLWTTEGGLLIHGESGSWYVRRAVQELPAEYDGAVLVPADGHESITTTKGQEFARLTFTTKQDLWYGPNLAARPGDWVIQTTAGDRLTPGTWRAA